MKKYKLFVACDTTSLKKIKKILDQTKNIDLVIGYKFGLEFLNSKNGRNFVKKLKNKVTFGDYKFCDIPNTCVSALKAVKDLNFNYITIHLSSGLDALKAVKKMAGGTKIVGVSVLTSLNNKSLIEIGYKKNLKSLVIHQARLATKANLDAIVCSPKEVRDVRKIFKKEIITPGIRLNKSVHDQKRVMTPKEAYKNGSDWIVVGRPITKGNIKNNIQKLIDNLN